MFCIGNVSEVALIDKASILITIALSILLLHEQFTWKIVLGTILMMSGLFVLTWK
ncbi:EamA family transporter [Leptospira brenneri]|uniref:EamA family transporter n=1 Tax=Leptospira brenneri TaxID=2023182 RepID=UPI001AEF47B8